MGMTMTQKILAAHAGLPEVHAGDLVEATLDIVLGNDVTIGFAASQGNYQLNVYAPVIIDTFLESAELLADSMDSFREHLVVGIEPAEDVIKDNLDSSLMLVTALSPHIGYENAAAIAKKAFEEGLTLKEAALESGLVSEEDYDSWVVPGNMV